nr:YetF domain-containing protein [Jiella sonneratiae]
MTAFDFVITLATGSLLATAASSSDWPAFLKAVVAIAALMAVQVALAFGRRRSSAVTAVVDNEPMLLMRDGAFIDAAMAESRVSPGDVYAKLRGANIQSMEEVRAVVLETSGDISVLHGKGFAPELLRHVRGAEAAGFNLRAEAASASRKA